MLDSDDLIFPCPECGHAVYPDNGGCGICSCQYCGEPLPGGVRIHCDTSKCRKDHLRRSKQAEAAVSALFEPLKRHLQEFGKDD